MRHDVEKIVIELYTWSRRYHAKRGIAFQLTPDEYKAKWSAYRLRKLEQLIDKGGNHLADYLTNPRFRPVLGWTSREARATGVMHDGNCSIQVAQDQRYLFQFKEGDKHSPTTIQKMRKPKSDRHRAAMSAAATKRWAKVREGGAA
jgi:hypothetical protein